MRLWTVHPCYLDAKGLVAAWREALLAQKVLRGATRGYRHHPQLARFRSHPEPLAAIAAFLAGIAREAKKRGYCFNTSKIARRPSASKLAETHGQLLYEWRHLKSKLRRRAPERYHSYRALERPARTRCSASSPAKSGIGKGGSASAVFVLEPAGRGRFLGHRRS